MKAKLMWTETTPKKSVIEISMLSSIRGIDLWRYSSLLGEDFQRTRATPHLIRKEIPTSVSYSKPLRYKFQVNHRRTYCNTEHSDQLWPLQLPGRSEKIHLSKNCNCNESVTVEYLFLHRISQSGIFPISQSGIFYTAGKAWTIRDGVFG